MDFFTSEIYQWYSKNKRDLPWRSTKDAYKIWISEIMLQQTRVFQATDYYNRFIDAFPTVSDLANAPEDHVLKLWQGLGYYTRARNLHTTAKILTDVYHSIFPDDYRKILALKGIGSYTAAAVASIAFDLPYAAVDGNVARVLSRFFGITEAVDSVPGKRKVQKIATDILPSAKTGFHTQALMEFGALQCVPKSPNCSVCPLYKNCFASLNGQTASLPFKTKKKGPINRFFYFFVIENKNSVFLEKRTGMDIWKNLYQFPLHESSVQLSDEQILTLPVPIAGINAVNIKSVTPLKKHQLTHQTIYARFIYVESDLNYNNQSTHINWVHKKDILTFAVPILLEPIIKNLAFCEI